MSDLKTRPTDQNPEDFLEKVEHPTRKSDGFELYEMMKEITKEEPVMWGSSIIRFGSYHYKYASGREADWLKTGFSPRKRSLSVYISQGFDGYEELLMKLGKHRLGKGCLYINKLADIDKDVLKQIIRKSYTS
jgi:hypothetical protein